ncbi:MAG TPA: helix-turn-helix transcriptional regulator [Pyrinomonadaceae bacterium]|nr:helix-turn-helix transcriptional regulator [Pyrinomonadaceae bacterium]
MGKKPRPRPERLAEKLLQIRNALGVSQGEMFRLLGIQDEVESKRISDYETGKNEPSLMTVLQYSRIAGVHTEVLIDDTLDLPAKLPGDVHHEEIKRKYAPRGKKR